MSCYPAAWEITSICADFLVVDAVSPNRSPARFPCLQGKEQGTFIKSGSSRVSLTIICAQFHKVTSKFPVNWNRE